MANSTEKLKLVNDSKYLGDRSWSWNVWLEGPEVEQGKVVSVKYFLHPTFKNPVHLITDKSSKFKLSGSGWGEFNIKAEVLIEGEKKLTLNHWLEFDAEEKMETLKTAKGSVFLSHSVADGPIANKLAGLLTAKGYQVKASAMMDVSAGTDWQKEIKNNMNRADVNVVLISPGMSEYISSEISYMLSSSEKYIGGKLLPVLLGSADIEESLGYLQCLRISSMSEIEIVVDAVEKLIKN
jgi:transcription initiation factor IIF auxiliary subunit